MNRMFEIPFRLPGLNEVNAENRKNPYAGAKLKSQTDAQLVRVIRLAKVQPVQFPCIVHMTFEEPNRRRDADNVESAKKFILDALVKSGVLRGDSPRYVIGSPSFTRYVQGGAKVLVTIIEDENADRLRQLIERVADAASEMSGALQDLERASDRLEEEFLNGGSN